MPFPPHPKNAKDDTFFVRPKNELFRWRNLAKKSFAGDNSFAALQEC